MISRRTAKIIAATYREHFVSKQYSYEAKRTKWKYDSSIVHDYLYEHEYDVWVLNAVKLLFGNAKRDLLEFIMKMHTGETFVSETPDWERKEREQLGQRYLKDLAEDIINSHRDKCCIIEDELLPSLELEGFTFTQNKLFYSEANILDEAEEEGIIGKIVDMLNIKNKKTILHHLDLSREHYQAKKWDDSISNSRKFLECILQEIAKKAHSIKTGKEVAEGFDIPMKVREYLCNNDLIERKEKEAIASIYSLLSNTGGHPYIAEKDQARLLRNVALTFSHFILLRFQGFTKSHGSR